MVNIYECCYKSIRKQYKTILNYEESVFADNDIEDVHQMRVGVRRIRSALRSFKPCIDDEHEQLVLPELKKLARRLGSVRDIDISILCFEQYKRDFPENEGVVFLIDYYQKKRDVRIKKLFKYLNSKRYKKLKKNVLLFLKYLSEKAKEESEKGVVCNFYSSFEKIIDEVFHYSSIKNLKDSEDDLHKMRIAIKYLRYNLEFINVKEKEAKRIIKILKNYQEKLGIINDCVIMNYRITKIMATEEIEQFLIEGIENFLDYNESFKTREKNDFDFPWDVLSSETIKKLYIPDL